jgi:hypothetical protein
MQLHFTFMKSFAPFSHQDESRPHETAEFQKVQNHSELDAFPFAKTSQILVIVMGNGASSGRWWQCRCWSV